MRKALKFAVLAIVAALAVSQFIRPERSNPPADPRSSFEAVARPPQHVAAVLRRSCGDCHSHETVWPWYSKVAPMSLLVASDVNEGRAKLNLSRWDIYSPEMSKIKAKAMCKEVQAGEMPPWYYRPMHRGSGLNAEEVAAVCAL